MTDIDLGTALSILIEHGREDYQGVFTRRYGNLSGSDWVRRITEEDREFFARMGREFNQNGRMGGLVRAASAARDQRGRFAKGTAAPKPVIPF